MSISAIILAAGSSNRAKLNENKIYYNLNGKTVIEKSVLSFYELPEIDEIIVTTNESEFNKVSSLFSSFSKVKIVLGGCTRSESVYNALKKVNNDFVIVHDGARPFASTKIIEACIECVKQNGSAVPKVPIADAVAKIANDKILSVEKGLYSLQTPQGFITKELINAFESVKELNYPDESSLYLDLGKDIYTYEGSTENKKLTYPSDFKTSEDIRVGTGFDLHRLEYNRKLILGGIEIPHEKGLLGHSDADVLVHAIMDAMLSALALGDIGIHFPDTDNKYKDISSMLLLEKVKTLVLEKGYSVKNVSATILAEKPKLSPYIPKIQQNLASALDVDIDRVGLGCTTLEKIGTVGREEGIAVSCFIQLVKN